MRPRQLAELRPNLPPRLGADARSRSRGSPEQPQGPAGNNNDAASTAAGRSRAAPVWQKARNSAGLKTTQEANRAATGPGQTAGSSRLRESFNRTRTAYNNGKLIERRQVVRPSTTLGGTAAGATGIRTSIAPGQLRPAGSRQGQVEPTGVQGDNLDFNGLFDFAQRQAGSGRVDDLLALNARYQSAQEMAQREQRY